MSFEMRDRHGRRVNSAKELFEGIKKEVINTGLNLVAKEFCTFAMSRTSHLRCPVHALPVESVDAACTDGQLNASFEGCCEELGKLAETTIASAIANGEFQLK